MLRAHVPSCVSCNFFSRIDASIEHSSYCVVYLQLFPTFELLGLFSISFQFSGLSDTYKITLEIHEPDFTTSTPRPNGFATATDSPAPRTWLLTAHLTTMWVKGLSESSHNSVTAIKWVLFVCSTKTCSLGEKWPSRAGDHPHPVPRLRMSGAILPVPHVPLWHVHGILYP